MGIFFCIILAFLISMLIYNVLLVRFEIAYRNHCKILDAAYCYALRTHNYEIFIRITAAMESIDTTAKRWFDFGCKNILPRVYYEMIAPYIE